MKRSSACIAVGLLVAGCAGQVTRPPTTEVTRIPESGDWFCQLAPDGTGWECVQDPELAEKPVPERLPEAAVPPRPLPPVEQPGSLEPPALPDDRQEVDEEPEAPARPPALPPEEPPPVPPPIQGAAAPPDLMDLPRTHYAVQLLAMSTRQELEAFVQRRDLDVEELTVVRVERNGALYHVLLLGIFPTLDEARRAVDALAQPLRDITPWIRPLGSLQAAMARAEAVAASGGV